MSRPRDDAELLPLPRRGWRVSANVNESLASQAIDGALDTRWYSGPRQAETWFELDFGAVQSVSAISMKLRHRRRHVPRAYRLEVSVDGKTWRTVVEDHEARASILSFLRPTRLSMEVRFPTTSSRFLRITTLDHDSEFLWSIHEIEVLR